MDQPNSTQPLGNMSSDMNPKKGKRGGKKKGQEDNVVEPNGQSSDDFAKEGKKRKRGNKKAGQKGRDDNLASGPSSKSRKSKQQQDTLVTNANPTT